MTNYLVITGGSRGIGKAAIHLFSQKGWQIINISRSNCDISNVKNFNIDLGNPDSLAKFQDVLIKESKDASKICLIHNAAKFQTDNVVSLSEHELRSVLEINLVAAFALNKVFLPLMKEKSSIIYIGSTLAEQAVPGRASYVISKHALIGLMRATTQDLAGKNIHTCCVCPGFVNTEMLTENIDPRILEEFIKKKVTSGRLIETQEMAEFLYFCAENPLINGSVLHANLGQVMS